MLVAASQSFETKQGFYNALGAADGNERLLYIHGFNNNHADGVLRAAQMAEDYEFEGPAIHFSWASAAVPYGYAYDNESALQARDALEDVAR